MCCLNPDCDQPLNPDSHLYCQHCGTLLSPIFHGHYRINRRLGRGGFGITYLAEDLDKLNESCVVKQLAPRSQGTQAQQKATQLFADEAKQLQQLGKHPQIPRLEAYFWENNAFYLVQEFIEGADLLRELELHGPFNEEKIRAVLLNLLPVLQFVHENQVIHRDVKPENIMRRHEDDQLVLIDFGVAKRVTTALGNRTGTTIGSYGYAAPEQMEGGKATPATDLYGLGATCFHLMSGVNPWDLWKRQGYGWVQGWRNHVSYGPSGVLGRVLDQLLLEDPHQRYPSAALVLNDLKQQPQPAPSLSPQPVSPAPVTMPTLLVQPLPPPLQTPVIPNPPAHPSANPPAHPPAHSRTSPASSSASSSPQPDGHGQTPPIPWRWLILFMLQAIPLGVALALMPVNIPPAALVVGSLALAGVEAFSVWASVVAGVLGIWMSAQFFVTDGLVLDTRRFGLWISAIGSGWLMTWSVARTYGGAAIALTLGWLILVGVVLARLVNWGAFSPEILVSLTLGGGYLGIWVGAGTWAGHRLRTKVGRFSAFLVLITILGCGLSMGWSLGVNAR